MISKLSLSFFPFAQWTQWRSITIYWLFSHILIWWRQSEFCTSFPSRCKIFSFFVCKIWYSKLLFNRTLQASAQTFFDIRLRSNTLKFRISFTFDFVIFAPIYSFSVVQLWRKLNEHEFLWFGKNCESASDKLFVALCNSTVSCSSHSKWMSGFILRALHSSAHWAFWSW